MPRDMFGDVVDPSIKLGSQKWYTVPLSILAHVAAVRGRHHHSADGDRRAADAAVDDGVRRRRRRRRRPRRRRHRRPRRRAPKAADAGGQSRTRRRSRRRRKSSLRRRRCRASASACPAVSKAACPVASIGGVVGGLPEAPPPPPPPPHGAGPRRWQHQGRRPRPKNVKPVYPPIAQSARVQGVVIIEATIGADGTGQGRESAPLDPAARPGGARRREAVGVHADAAERRAGAGHHDRHGELHAAVARFDTGLTNSGCSSFGGWANESD